MQSHLRAFCLRLLARMAAVFYFLAICSACGTDVIDSVTDSFDWPHAGKGKGSASGQDQDFKKPPLVEDSQDVDGDEQNRKTEAALQMQYFSGSVYRADLTVWLRFCFEMSSVEIDRYAGDPDMENKGFVYQEVQNFWSDQSHCKTELEHNGMYLRSCDGLYLIADSDWSQRQSGLSGEVYTSADRNTGPVGSFAWSAVKDCRNQPFSAQP